MEGFQRNIENNLNLSFNVINQQMNMVQNNIILAESCQANLNKKIESSGSFMENLQKKAAGLVHKLASMENIEMVLGLSDEFTGASTQLARMNDGMQSQKELQEMVYAAAGRSRTGYMEMMNTVAQLGTRAQDVFGSNAEALQFSENLNKMFAINGTGAGDISAVTDQIIQGMEAGTFSAQTMNSIFQATPGMLQTMADSLGMPAEKLQEMADQGGLTADIVKNALLGATDSINQGFSDVPMTFGDIATQVKSAGIHMFEPILEKLNEVANNEQFQAMLWNIIGILGIFASIVAGVFDAACNIGYFIADNWGMIAPVIYGIIAALGIYMVCTQVSQIIEGIGNGLKTITTWMSQAHANSLRQEAAAQLGLNTALLSCPIVWIILGIVALIAVIYLVVAAFNHLTGSSVSATGLICGAVAVAGAYIGNIIIGIYNFIVTIGISLYNYIAMFVNFFASVFDNPVEAIAHLFANLFTIICDVIKGAAGLIDTLLGTNIGDAIAGFQDFVEKGVDDILGEQKVLIQPLAVDDYLKDKIDYKGAFDTGNKIGTGIADKVKGFNPKNLLSGGDDQSDILGGAGLNSIAGTPINPTANNGLENITNNTSATANNTEEIKNSVDISKTDLKYLRDLAEQKIVNRFTTAEIKVDMKNYNSVNNDQDLDGMSEILRKKLVEQMNIAAEGVHT